MPYRRLIGRTRSRPANLLLAALLTVVAGMVDVSGYLRFRQFTSHMTGTMATVAAGLVSWQPRILWSCLLVAGSFLCGSASCALLVNFLRRRNCESLFAVPLLLESVMLGIAGGLTIHAHVAVLIALLAYAMGLQNAIITKISGAEIRTTHVTGMITDIGIELGRALYPNNAHHQEPVRAHRGHLAVLVLLVVCFLVGGVSAAALFPKTGMRLLIPVAAFLLSLTLYPIYRDMRHPKGSVQDEVPTSFF